MPRIVLTKADAIPEGTSLEVVAEGRIFAVFNVDGTFHVLDGLCAHAGGPIGKGTLQGNIVTCPWHGWQYDVQTGHHCLNQRICQSRYEARIEEGNVTIDLSP